MPNLAREPESFRCPNCAEWINTEAILCRYCHCGLSSEHFHPCTFCAEMVRKEATRCRYCQSDLPEASAHRKIDMRPFEPRVVRSYDSKPKGFSVNVELVDERAEFLCALIRKELNLKLEDEPDEQVRARIRELVNADPAPLTMMEKGVLLQKILDELFGFGPLGTLLRDPSVRDIYVYDYNEVHVERVVPNDKLEPVRKGVEITDVAFKDEEHVRAIIARIFKNCGVRFSKKSPMSSCTLPNGSTVTAIMAPRSNRGAMLIIRTVDPK